jgi:hypothetical protein
MTVAGTLYGKVHLALWNKEIDWNESEKIAVSLHTSSYTPSRAHDYFDDVDNEVEGTGYTAGGQALTTPTLTFVDDADAAAWVANTAYAVGDIIRPVSANGLLYLCVVAGTSHATTEPTLGTVVGRETADDGTLVWLCIGYDYVKLDADNPSWASATITARYAIFRYNTGTAGTSPLIGYWDFGSNYVSTNGTFELIIPTAGLFHFFNMN